MKANWFIGSRPAPEWLYEVKLDGYRALAAKQGDSIRLLSLKNKILTTAFPAVVEDVRGLVADTVLIDGEIVAIDKHGCPSFRMLQHRSSLGRDCGSSIMPLTAWTKRANRGYSGHG
jgi:ATP-dependent DNA ligase